MTFFHARTALYALLALVTITVFTGQHLVPPMDRDESRFAQASRQMMQSGDYVTIRFQDELRAKKPAGIYWLQAASANLLGESDIASYRFVNVLALLASIFILYHIGLRLYEPHLALAASAAFASGFLVLAEAHLAKTDTVLMLAVLVQQWALMRIYLDRQANPVKPRADWIWFWGAMAVGILIKGPIAPAIAILTIGSLLLCHRQMRWVRQLRLSRGLLLVAMICLPWAILVTLATDGAFLDIAVKGDFLAKVQSGQESHGAPPFTYLASLGLLLWPASILLPSACLHIKALMAQDQTRFLLAWIVPFWLMIELIPTKLPHYPLPVVPAVALLLVCSVGRVVTLPPVRQKIFLAGQYLLLALGVVLAAVVGVAAVRFGGDSVRLAIGFFGLAVIIAGLAVWQGHRWIQAADYRNLLALWAAGLLLHFTIFAGVVPNLARVHVADAVAEQLNNAANPATAIAAAGFHEPSLVFLLGRDLLLVDSREAALFLAEAPNGVALVEARQQTAFLDMARRLNLSLAAPQQVSGYNISKGQDVVILIYRRETFDANSDTE
ncbi:glycosyltransferase family 39 protein [Alphaproteobacteria bacterium]|nr:glycosyltransferase family 39 protein [Alphaproteobacteria bacterium]MDC1120859.1 glycosyltransferase family 39 protein [Alphaproteobacteria bacterium]